MDTKYASNKRGNYLHCIDRDTADVAGLGWNAVGFGCRSLVSGCIDKARQIVN